MDKDDDELFSSILSLCEEDEDAPAAGDAEVSDAVCTDSGGRPGQVMSNSCDTSIALSPIKHATPLKMADTLNNNYASDKFTPKTKSGLDLFKSMLLQQRKTSTPLMDRWSLTKSGQSREGKRRHDVDAISSNLETIAEQGSSDEEQTLRRDEDADITYDDLLHDLSVLCDKELTERCEIVNAEPPENKIRAEHQISRIDLDSILQKTSSATRVVGNNNTQVEKGTSAVFKSEPGRFTGVNTTTQSSSMALEDSDSFEDADDILGLDEFLGSDEEDNDYDSLLEDTIFQEEDVTVVHVSTAHVSAAMSSSLQTRDRSSVHKADATQKIPTYKCINSLTSNTNSFLALSSVSAVPTSEAEHVAVSISNDSAHKTDLANTTTCTVTSVSVVSSVCTKSLPQSSVSPTTSVKVLSLVPTGIGKTESKLLTMISVSKESTANSTFPASETNSQLKTVSLRKSPCSSEKVLASCDTEFPDNEKKTKEHQLKEQENVSDEDRLSQEDEFTLDLTKDSDELDEFLHKEGFKVIDDFKDSSRSMDREKRGNATKNLVKKDKAQISQMSKCSKAEDTETGNELDTDSDYDVLDQYVAEISPTVPKPSQTEEIPVVKNLCETINVSSDVFDSLAGQKMKSTDIGESLIEQNVESVVNKVVAWQATCVSSEQNRDDTKVCSNESKAKSPVPSSQTVAHTLPQQDRKALPQVHVHPFKMQVHVEPEVTPVASDESPSGKNCRNNISNVETASVLPLAGSSQTKAKLIPSSAQDSSEVIENNNVVDEVDKNQNIVTPSLYHDYEAERRFIQGENSLMKQVMRKWGSKGIQTPDINLSYSNRMRKNNPHYQSRLEGQKISTMWIGVVRKHQHYKEAKRTRTDFHSQLNNINDFKQQLQDINKAVRDEIGQSIMVFGEKQDNLDHVFVQRRQALNTQQQLELCQARRHINPHMLQCQLLQLSCEHQHQRDQLAYIFNSEMNQLKNNHQEHVHAIRSRFEQRAHQLKSFIEQLTTVESTQTNPQFGPHVVTNLVKGPCRSNNNKSSTVTVCLPADVATAIIKEDEVYNMYYVHTKK